MGFMPIRFNQRHGFYMDERGNLGDVDVKVLRRRGKQGAGSAYRHRLHEEKKLQDAAARAAKGFGKDAWGRGAWGKDASDSAPPAWSGAKGSKDAWDNAPPAWSGAKGKGGKDIAPDKLNKYMGYTTNKFIFKIIFPLLKSTTAPCIF